MWLSQTRKDKPAKDHTRLGTCSSTLHQLVSSVPWPQGKHSLDDWFYGMEPRYVAAYPVYLAFSQAIRMKLGKAKDGEVSHRQQ